MKKILSLIKACMTEDMNLFKVSTKKKTAFSKYLLPIFISICLMGSIFSYSELFMNDLKTVKMEFVLLTIFILFTSIMTLIEGIYKSSSLLFNCKDDNLLLSLPIKKSTVLFIRVFKFYVFELMYNSIFLIPSIIVYAKEVNPGVTYYIVSIIGLLLFPIVPILISCIFGGFISFFSSKFKGKNYAQTIITMLLLLVILYFSYNSQSLISNIAKNASSINDLITKIYYPAGAYIDLILKFDILKLLEFIAVNIGLLILVVILIGKLYFNINSSSKAIKSIKTNKNYKIKTNSITKSLIKKEFNRFVNSTVFITNAGFGLVLFIAGCILFVIKFDSFSGLVAKTSQAMSFDYITNSIPVLLFGFICFASFMTSITSSMISLEGKSFSILKSLPVKPYTIVKSKILAALLIMIPCILIGDIIVFINFRFSLLSILLIVFASFLLPLLSETIGIIINLKYPRMDAKNDTEVVKQSMSSFISVIIGIILTGVTIYALFKCMDTSMSNNSIILIFVSIYLVICISLLKILQKTCEKSFNNISV